MMKVFMQAQDVLDAVKPTYPKDDVEVHTDKMAMTTIYHGIPKKLLLSLMEKESTEEAWEPLNGGGKSEDCKNENIKGGVRGVKDERKWLG